MEKLDQLPEEVLEQFIDRYRDTLNDKDKSNYNAIRSAVRTYAGDGLVRALEAGYRRAGFLNIETTNNPLFDLAVRDGLIRWHFLFGIL